MRMIKPVRIAIALLLVTISLYLFAPSANRGDSRSLRQLTIIKMNEIRGGLELFQRDLGRYPSTEEGLKYLIQNGDANPLWMGPYMNVKEVSSDAWGHSLLYLCPGRHDHYDLISYGRDGSKGGVGQNEDITISDKRTDN